jgi:RHS repeat-associated protein
MNGLVTTLAYSGGLVSTITDPASRTTTLAYTGAKLTTLTDPDSGVWRFGYDSANDLTTLTDPRSANTSADTTTFTYGLASRATSVTQPDGTSESLTAMQLQGFPASGTGTQGNPATAVLAAAGGAAFTDPRSNVWTTGLDWLGFGVPTSQADSLGDTALTYRDTNALPWLSADALGRRTRRVFDSSGNPTLVVQPDDTQVQSTFNSFAEPTKVVESGGGSSATVTYTYDTKGNLTQLTDALNNVYTYTYTSKGSVATVMDPAGSVTTYNYDTRNRRTSAEDPLLNTVTYGYDSASDMTSLQNPLGFTSTFSYDALGRLLGQTVPLTATTAAVTTFTFDAAGNLVSLKDPVSNLTTFAFDGMNRETGSTDPLGHATTYVFDAAGNLSSATDRDNRQTTFSYDAADRRTGETWVNSSPAYSATFGYNAAGQLTSQSDPFSSYQLGYDSEGRPSTVSDSGTPGLPSVTLTYGYDALDNRTSVTDSLGGTITSTYDLNHNLKSSRLSVSGTADANVSFSYDSLNRLTNLTRTIPGGTADTITSTFGYDRDSNLTGITHKDTTSSTTLANFTYTYDAAGRVSGYTGFDGTLTYTYDRSGELTGVSGAHNESYSYDANGNRTMTGYSTGTGNELSSDGVYNYTYDNEGNLLTETRISDGQVTTNTWDYENRLTEVVVKTSGGTVLQDDKFTFDVEGRRIGKNTLSGGQTWTLYDRGNPYADFNSSGTLTYRYLYGNGLDSLLARFDGTNTVWYLTDKLGSVRQMVGSTGTVLDQLTYDSFGNLLAESSPSNGDRFKFTGREYDSEIRQYYYRARPYASTIGRFVSQDLLGFTPGDTNLYRYVQNKPTGAKDPSGLWRVGIDLHIPIEPIPLLNVDLSGSIGTGGSSLTVGLGIGTFAPAGLIWWGSGSKPPAGPSGALTGGVPLGVAQVPVPTPEGPVPVPLPIGIGGRASTGGNPVLGPAPPAPGANQWGVGIWLGPPGAFLSLIEWTF